MSTTVDHGVSAVEKPGQEEEQFAQEEEVEKDYYAPDNEDDEKRDAGCRPCCSVPHGWRSIVASVIGSIAWIFTLSSMMSCHYLEAHFMYCHPPPPKKEAYGSCGDCHCINKDDPCPTGSAVPPTVFSEEYMRQLRNLVPTNPYQMTCNPYNTTGPCTDPPQLPEQIELWETAVCGAKYNMSSLTEENCPTEYTLVTYNTRDEMEADGAQMTHWGACGACSTTEDLAVYMEHPDLTGKGQECGVRGLIDNQDGIDCFMEVGYTYPCAEMWMYNVFNTRDHCFDVCIDFTFFSAGHNSGPPPECKIANCLLCDEQMSGPYFQEVAARSRRRSGLLSKIPRPCDVILIVPHEEPCKFTQRAVAAQQKKERRLTMESAISTTSALSNPSADRPPNLKRWRADTPDESPFSALSRRDLQSSERPPDLEKWRAPEPTETCFYIQQDLGLLRYADTTTNNWLFGDNSIFLSENQLFMTSRYDTCTPYELRNVDSGFWYNMKDIFGSNYKAAKAFIIVATTIGGIALVFTWFTLCVAYAVVFWRVMTGIFAFCGVFALLSLLFLNSGVCSEGCSLRSGAGNAIAAGILWFLAAFFCCTTGHYNKDIPRAACCCCPSAVSTTAAVAPAAYSPMQSSTERGGGRTDVSITETVQSDGSTVIEKVTTYPNGEKDVEVTTKKKAAEEKQSAAAETEEQPAENDSTGDA